MTRGVEHEQHQRCPWAGSDPLYVAYHDTEWGVPKNDDIALFEKLILEGFQAGLSWLTILRKRENFRTAFDGFDPARMAAYGPKKLKALMSDAGIVRNRLKIEASVDNARAYLALRQEMRLSEFLWDFVDGRTVQNKFRAIGDVPAQTETSKSISKALKQRGFRFVGPTTVYAFMQSVGMVNDHLVGCPCHRACAKLATTFKP